MYNFNNCYYLDSVGKFRIYNDEVLYKIVDKCERGTTLYANIQGCPVELDPDTGFWVAERTVQNRDNWGRVFVELESISDKTSPLNQSAKEWLEFISGKSWEEVESMDLLPDTFDETDFCIDISNNNIKNIPIKITQFNSKMLDEGFEDMFRLHKTAEYEYYFENNIKIYKISENLYSVRGEIKYDNITFDELINILHEKVSDEL